MTMLENSYPPGWQKQSPHTSDESHVLQRGESIPVTEQEDEAWDYIAAKRGARNDRPDLHIWHPD